MTRRPHLASRPPRRVSGPGLALALALAHAPAALGAGGAYAGSAHGDRLTGVYRVADVPRGACAQCHVPPRAGAPGSGGLPGAERGGLFARNDNGLCYTCHPDLTRAGSYQGRQPYEQGLHATSAAMAWPGPRPRARSGSDAGKCVNCHDPHGVRDEAGRVPALLAAREDRLCLGCHDRSPAAKDVKAQFSRPYAHPLASGTRHAADEGGSPARFGAGDARHVTCSDCHDPHVLREDRVAVTPPDAPGTLVAVGRVRVTNGGPGATPLYTWAGAADTSFPREHEVCFKCHSSWTRQPAGQSDLAALLNPNNASYHPVEAQGRDARADPASFVNGWRADRTLYCSDCHGSDDANVKGPHGSNHRHLLRKPYAATTTATRRPNPADLCFDCHRYEVYADPAFAGGRASRFNAPAAAYGHAFHVGSKGVGCFACHQSHGSALYPALLVMGRTPGLTSFFSTASGGTCGTSCHAPRSYAANYPR